MLIGIGLFPLAFATSFSVYTLCKQSMSSTIANNEESWALPAGFITWVLIFLLLPRPSRTYVLGHELTHALWAILMGGRVKAMKIGKDGGHVELTRTNFIITLAPYFFPFYTFIILTTYYVIGLWIDLTPFRAWGLAAVGLTWSFHLTFTIHMLTQQQPDVQEHGRIFSYLVIYTMNILLIGIWMTLLGSPTFSNLGTLLHNHISDAYQQSYDMLLIGYEYIVDMFKPDPV